MSPASARNRQLAFGALCLVLAIVAAVAGSWIPCAVLAVVGVVFIGRAMTLGSR